MEDKYISFTSDQFAAEESFIRWVSHGVNHELWTAWVLAHPPVRKNIEEARHIVADLFKVSGELLTETGKKDLWNKIHTQINSGQQEPIRRNIKQLWKWGLAAAAALTLLVWFNTITHSDMEYARNGQQKEITLPEESIVTLNASSVLQYKERTFEKKRTIQLYGEAFFNVQPGSTFSVKTDYGTITVLGTSFNVIAWPGRFEVSCFTGKVKVETLTDQETVITPGEKTVQDQKSKDLNKSSFIATGTTPEWMNGKFIFENQPLSVVVAELERQYNIKVTLTPELELLPYTGLFESGDLDTALSLITWPLHLKSKTEGTTVTISR